ncbi:MAG: penicillin-binding protein 2, partial [Clostridia bacterium]|nr:penicillin-binding protein 2 [Clostridia bacterium]
MKFRGWILLFVFIWGFIAIGGRLAYIGLGEDLLAAARGQSSYGVVVDTPRGTVFDRTGEPITNRAWETRGVILPTPQGISQVHTLFFGEKRDLLLTNLQQGLPVCIPLPAGVSVDGMVTVACRQHFSTPQPAAHLVGYLDGSGRQGVYGLQQGYDSFLQGKETTVTFVRDAAGGFLQGSGSAPEQDLSVYEKGVMTTLWLPLQQAVEEAFPSLKKGAVVVSRCQTGEMLAGASFPAFSPADVAASLENTASPLVNRMLAQYNVGSVFKLCVAAAALEQGISPEDTYCCTGQIQSGQTFHCHKSEGHGPVNMEQALAVSCNPYFIHLAGQVGAQAVYDMAVAMGFGTAQTLCEGITEQQGVLPSLQEMLRSPAELANFAIGQGSFLATPLQINRMTAAIANGGVYFPSGLVMGLQEQKGKVVYQKGGEGRRICSTGTAGLLQKMMQTVMTQGTGKAGYFSELPAGGKTSTAQTGMVNEKGQGVTQAWFTGFVPADTPEYAITV